MNLMGNDQAYKVKKAMQRRNDGVSMESLSRQKFPAAFLIAGLLAASCAGRADPPFCPISPAPPVTLSAEADRSVCIQISNVSGAQVELRSLLVSKIRNTNYRITQECGNAGYALDIRVLEIRRAENAEGPVPEEDFLAADGPVIGMGIGSGMGGRSGARVGMGFGLAFPIGTRRLPTPTGYAYIMIAELEIEEATQYARVKHQTQLQVATPAPSEAAALPHLEAKMAESVSALLPR
jgi:hypothetical protein